MDNYYFTFTVRDKNGQKANLIEEFNRLKLMRWYLSDCLENIEIYKIIKERVLDRTEPVVMITMQEMEAYMKKRRIDMTEDEKN